jgi:uncharacterized membrane protein YwzB
VSWDLNLNQNYSISVLARFYWQLDAIKMTVAIKRGKITKKKLLIVGRSISGPD